ncbi:MAG: restriction endonuclease subunit S [Monoglobales bacterium]
MANESGIVSPAYTVLRCKKPHSNLFYEAYFHTDEFINHVLSKSVEGIRDGRQISYDEFKWLSLPYCDVAEQDKISQLFCALNKRIEKQQQLVEMIHKYKRGLISEILKQKLVITHECEKWEEVALSDVADGFEYGMNAAATSFDGEHKYIRITDIDDDTHTYIDCDPVSPSGVLEEKYRVREDDILFARTGASVGKSYLYRKTDGDLSFAGFLIRIHVKEGIDSEYVFLNTLTEEYDKWVRLESARSGQPGINAEQYRRYRFKLPSLNTQRRIATIARKIDAQIQKESMCLRLLQEQKLGLLQQLFI